MIKKIGPDSLKLHPHFRWQGVVMTATACYLLYIFSLMYTLTAIFGESVFYHTGMLGILVFFLGLGVWTGSGGRGEEKLFARAQSALAVTGGGASVLVFLLMSFSIRLRTPFLEQLHQKFKEDVSLWDVIRTADASFFKVLITSPVPTYGLLLVVLALIGALGGVSLVAAGRISTRKDAGKRLSPWVGAFAAGVIFPLVLYPNLNLFRISLLAGILNAAGTGFFITREKLERRLWWPALVGFFILLGLYLLSPRLEALADRNVYRESPDTAVIDQHGPPHRRVALVKSNGGNFTSLYVNRVQIFTHDRRAADNPIGVDDTVAVLSHVPMAIHRSPERALVLGGGDGLVIRELVKYELNRITVVEPNRDLVALSRGSSLMDPITGRAMRNPIVKVKHWDPFAYVRSVPPATEDVVISVFPNSVDYSLARAYSVEFFRDVKRILREWGILVVHTDYYGVEHFWTVLRSLREAGFRYVLPLNDNHYRSDSLEGILVASVKEPLRFFQLELSPYTRMMLNNGVLPQVGDMLETARPEVMDLVLSDTNPPLNSRFRPAYLRGLRQVNGFPLPLFFNLGPY